MHSFSWHCDNFPINTKSAYAEDQLVHCVAASTYWAAIGAPAADI